MTFSRKLRVAWVSALALGYGAFVVWYGGSSRPVTAEEGRAYVERVRSIAASTEHPEMLAGVEELIRRDDGREFYMANLIARKPGEAAEREDAAYARAVLPALLKRASFPIYIGTVSARVLGDDANGINQVAIVRYRSLRDFMEIFADPAMSEGIGHKFAALSYTEARATSPTISAVTVRSTVALGLLLLAVLGWVGLES